MSSNAQGILDALNLSPDEPGAYDGDAWFGSGDTLPVHTPIDGSEIATVQMANGSDYDRVVEAARASFEAWRTVPAPERGKVVRDIGVALREHQDALGDLVTLEMGKIREEGWGEVQEAVDIAEFATGLSRQLYGKQMVSERPDHRLYEQWHPLGVVGIITAFNFPVAVWAWNSFIAAVCGDTCVWKPSELTPLTSIATTRICNDVVRDHGHDPIFFLTVGRGQDVGDRLARDERMDLVSATGSIPMGYKVYENVAKRMGKVILELGGNNGIIVTEHADLDLAQRAITFAGAGTTGQRCTTSRRIIAHSAIVDELQERLVSAYEQVPVGNPLEEGTLMGPLVHEQAADAFEEAVRTVKKQGGTIVTGGERRHDLGPNYVEPTIARVPESLELLKEETFAPLLYLIEYDGSVDEAITINNSVPQGLSSAIFTENLKQAERFLSAQGSDCGIANVNIGTSGAEIGGAFGGEKDTGGGREAGSDSWKQYMRRQTVTINYGEELPLSQGIDFGVE